MPGAANGTSPVAPELSCSTINRKVIAAEYAVRGEIVRRAQQIQEDLEKGRGSYPFDRVVFCNIGNPQLLGQKPLTFFRQVLAICEYPELLQHEAAAALFPADVIKRARQLLESIPGGLGAYSESPGASVLRQQVANAIERRDGHPADPEDIYMTDGASPAVHYIIEMLIRSPADSLMVPIPQYPLYSATLTLYGGRLVPYMLEEEHGWGMSRQHLEQQLAAGRRDGACVRGLVVINPGNPTGQCLSVQNMEDIIQFCRLHRLVLIADEVYQTNIYAPSKRFRSFKSVMRDLGVGDLALVSLHSTSKGFVGECGRRGGYMEVIGFPQDVREQILKLASVNLCPNVSGQVCCALMMNPPQPGDPSHQLYMAEKTAILGSLQRRAQLLVAHLNAMEGVSCNEAEGALYAFPRIRLPRRACETAAAIGKQPDWLYCKELLEHTGIVVVPGSGFGQQDGTFHFRTTFLPSEEDIKGVVEKLARFHAEFLERHGGLDADDLGAELTNGVCANGNVKGAGEAHANGN